MTTLFYSIGLSILLNSILNIFGLSPFNILKEKMDNFNKLSKEERESKLKDKNSYLKPYILFFIFWISLIVMYPIIGYYF